jgi:DNA-binding MarR family transcriptional regulator
MVTEGTTASPPKKYSVELVWTPMLGQRFTAVSSFFLSNMHRLGPPGGVGLTPTEAMVIIQLFSFKWDKRPPKPALGTIAKRLGLAVRTVRETVRRLEGLGLVRRELNEEGGCSRYYFEGLFERLEQLMKQDLEASDAAASTKEAA